MTLQNDGNKVFLILQGELESTEKYRHGLETAFKYIQETRKPVFVKCVGAIDLEFIEMWTELVEEYLGNLQITYGWGELCTALERESSYNHPLSIFKNH